MSDIDTLKTQRRSLKAKVTSASNRLRGIVKSNNESLINSALDALHQSYEQFCIADLEYCELVESDTTQYATYVTVNNLNLAEYSASVLETYNDAMALVPANRVSSPLDNQAVLAITNVRKFCNEFSNVLSDFDFDTACKLLEKARKCLSECQEILSKLASSNNSDLLPELGSYVTDLEFFMFKVELKVKSNTAQPTGQDVSRVSLSENISESNSNGGSRVASASMGVEPAISGTPSGDTVVGPSVGGPVARGASDAHSSGRSSIVHAYNATIQGLNHTPVLSSTSYNSMPHQSCTGRKYKEAPIPSFDGDRSRWGEFKSIWLRYARSEYSNDSDRAYALSMTLKGKAKTLIKSIRSDQLNAHSRMLSRLDRVYGDVSHAIQHCYNQLKSLKQVKEGDYSALVDFVSDVESVYSQLGDIDQLQAITMYQVDEVSELLPPNVEREWLKEYRDLDEQNKVHPFSAFMDFLDKEREVSFRKSERYSLKSDSNSRPKKTTKSFHGETKQCSDSEYYCVLHKSNTTHNTDSCYVFKSMSREKKFESLRKVKRCFRCFSDHLRSDCTVNDPCKSCSSTEHHVLLCNKPTSKSSTSKSSTSKSGSGKESNNAASAKVVSTETNAARSTSSAIYPMTEVQATDRHHTAMVFFDGGSNSTYITHAAARRLHARRLGPVKLSVTTMGCIETPYASFAYETYLRTTDGTKSRVIAFGMECITGPVEPLNTEVLQELFPGRDMQDVFRRAPQVDILLGNDHCGLHPETVIARAGEHLKIVEGRLGRTLQGTHPRLIESTTLLIDVKNISNVVYVESNITYSSPHKEFLNFSTQSHSLKSEEHVTDFIQGENLGTEITPKCGGCKCTKCPVVGHSYSFSEQQELDLIRRNLTYDEANQRWMTSYPWIKEPSTLPDNYYSALATLRNTEKTLQKDSTWAKIYSDQIKDMVERNVAKKLTKTELDEWQGPNFYISHLAVKNPGQKSV